MAPITHFFLAVSLVLLYFSSLSVIAFATDGDYVPKPFTEKPEQVETTMLGIQGMVYCRSSDRKAMPLEGAVARISCESVDRYGLEAEAVSFLSGITNAEGYFLATLSASEIQNQNIKLITTKCKASLELSSSDTCNFPTDENNGIAGAPFPSCRLLNNNNFKLCTLPRPFYFTTSSPPPTLG
ncbi:hypothetical protein FNV43_RR23574 [Rhamnella rubrinervis]|uniref:Uncharacterized protein n=1 Tax=Rhamnella rubrinervis TaxID=2594499 RepID=A0A8K0GPA6_9ROSA|nr:hypothetical protein FNV43_RR23574 [Rhamnella rubrinervis]